MLLKDHLKTIEKYLMEKTVFLNKCEPNLQSWLEKMYFVAYYGVFAQKG